MSDKEDIKKLIALHKRRLHKLKEKAAIEGRKTDPATLIEIEDIEAQINSLQLELKNLQAGQISTHSTAPHEFADPSGAVRPGSGFYIKRDAVDERLYEEISKTTGTTTTIRGPRQVGKTSLLIRAMAYAHKINRPTIYISLEEIDLNSFDSLDTLLYQVACMLVDGLALDFEAVKQAWDSPLIASRKFYNFLERYLLATHPSPFLLVLDEVETLLDKPFRDTFFGLIRGCHNRRASSNLWEKLHIIMAISTEPHLLIKNTNQSPFNVGFSLELGDFNQQEVCYLDDQYNTRVCDEHVDEFMALLGGHPYLTQRALYTLVTEQWTWHDIVNKAIDDQSPFARHLRRLLSLLQQEVDLQKAMKEVLNKGTCADKQIFNRLLWGGLIKGTPANTQCRCGLYKQYLENKL